MGRNLVKNIFFLTLEALSNLSVTVPTKCNLAGVVEKILYYIFLAAFFSWQNNEGTGSLVQCFIKYILPFFLFTVIFCIRMCWQFIPWNTDYLRGDVVSVMRLTSCNSNFCWAVFIMQILNHVILLIKQWKTHLVNGNVYGLLKAVLLFQWYLYIPKCILLPALQASFFHLPLYRVETKKQMSKRLLMCYWAHALFCD